MAQGAGKLKTKKVSGGKKKGGIMAKGRREIAPKRTEHVREVRTKKQLSAKINQSIERQMVNAASAGKLTIMKNNGGEDPAKKK